MAYQIKIYVQIIFIDYYVLIKEKISIYNIYNVMNSLNIKLTYYANGNNVNDIVIK